MIPDPSSFDPDDLQPEETIDLTLVDEEQDLGSAVIYRSVFDCPLCLSDVERPVATLCGHVFCYKCLDDFLNINKACIICNDQISGFFRVYFN